MSENKESLFGMLEHLSLEFTETGKLQLPVEGVTILVGPNNSGKSLLLKEFEALFEVHPMPSNLKIIEDYEIVWPEEESIDSFIAEMKDFGPKDLPIGEVALGRLNPVHGRQASHIPEDLIRRTAQAKDDKNWFTTQILRWGVIRLDGRSRFELTEDKEGGDLLAPSQNILTQIFKDDDLREKIRKVVYDAFGLHFVIDPTNLGTLRIRLSEETPLDDEQSLNDTARNFHATAMHIKDASDGVQAFIGIIQAISAGQYHTILVDEPEAFLHPPLARKLGRNLASIAAEKKSGLFAATHSADFLMGCVEASAGVRILRLEYNQGRSRARTIDPAKLESFFRNPLMRSANVVSGLFHDGVVICESDNDRAFYGEIYHRLASEEVGYPSILFVNAQNKQTIKDIMGPLREFGVPAAAIPDIDIVKDGGKAWTEWMKSAKIPDALHSGYGSQRSALKLAFEKSGRDMKRDGGVDILSGGDKAAANEFFDNLESYGIFAVRRGELEDWLSHLKVSGRKTDWTVKMFDAFGSDPSSAGYVRPQKGDVWDFMRGIVGWIRNSARKGAS